MAERRMFAKTIIDSDAFLDMPLSSQALYFHLSMRADDDGFLNNSQKIIRMVNASKTDYELLLAKNFIIPFENGICVIKHWRIHNYIRSDRYKPTVYQEELNALTMKDNKAYQIREDIPFIGECDSKNIDGIPMVSNEVVQTDTQDRLGKDRLGKDRIDINSAADCSKEQQNIYKEVINYLNFKANKNYKYTTKSTQKFISSRQKDGYVIEDFKKVIDNKCRDWLSNSDMNKYLRPVTLFGTKFESYLNEKVIVQTVKNKNKNGFNNFEGRQYDYDDLEKKLLGY